jgi:hypothetical protein
LATLDGAAVADYQWSQADSTAIVKIPACGKTPRGLTIGMNVVMD